MEGRERLRRKRRNSSYVAGITERGRRGGNVGILKDMEKKEEWIRLEVSRQKGGRT